MKVKDVRSLPWKKVKDWTDLPATLVNEECFVCATDVDKFVENIYRDISRKLNIPYKKLKPILIDENASFYSLKEQLFKFRIGYDKKDPLLATLENTLRIPDTGNLATDNVSKCLKLFEGLSNIEKISFLQKIGERSV